MKHLPNLRVTKLSPTQIDQHAKQSFPRQAESEEPWFAAVDGVSVACIVVYTAECLAGIRVAVVNYVPIKRSTIEEPEKAGPDTYFACYERHGQDWTIFATGLELPNDDGSIGSTSRYFAAGLELSQLVVEQVRDEMEMEDLRLWA